MSTFKTLMSSATALLLLAGPAAAVTVTNNSGEQISIGVRNGSQQEVKKIAAGKSATFACKPDCGVTGPWGYSWMAKGDDTFSTNGKSLINRTS